MANQNVSDIFKNIFCSKMQRQRGDAQARSLILPKAQHHDFEIMTILIFDEKM
jgi:hypothetical protein